MEDQRLEKNKVLSIVGQAKNIGIMASKVAGLDAYAAGVGLYYALKESDKKVSFIYPGKIPDGGEGLINEDIILKEVKDRTLVISIDYGDIEGTKVHYSTNEGVLDLKIKPVPDNFSKDNNIKTKVTGLSLDLVFIIGAQNLNDLGSSYRNLDLVSKISKIVNIDNNKSNERYGFINVVDTDAGSLSELVLNRIAKWDYNIGHKSAEALLKGVVSMKVFN